MTTGWTGKILRIDVAGNTIKTTGTRDYSGLLIGGRGIGIKLIYDLVDPSISATDPDSVPD